MSVIVSIGTAVPEHCFKQGDLSNFMANLFELLPTERRALHMMYAKSGIEKRYSAIADFGLEVNEWQFFPNSPEKHVFPSIEKRMAFYMQHAVPLALNAINKTIAHIIDLSEITHLITVSCTGMSAPGIDIEIVQQLNLNVNINRTSVNFMGCYASVHALKQAHTIVESDSMAKVLLVSVELCTLHFQKVNNHENHTANLLFADGAAAAVIVADDYARSKNWKGFQIHSFYSSLIFKGKADMAWHLTSSGFLMRLSAYIPMLIEQDFEKFYNDALLHGKAQINEIGSWAIHPGGRKILEVVSTSLKMENNELAQSYQVLNDYGNMSSPTILFVLKLMLENKQIDTKKPYAFGAAFGPGLTLESFILKHV